jgi:hypothetical protein
MKGENKMDEKYKSRLPNTLQADVDAIEAKFGKTIGVTVKGQPGSEKFAEWDGEGTAVYLTPASADIVLLTHDVPAHSLAHEVIHVRRKWLEQIPCYGWREGLDQGLANIASKLENDLEHIFIVREEIQLFPEAEMFWRKEYGEPSSKLDGHPFADRTNLLKGYMSATLMLRDDALANLYQPFLAARGLEAEAKAFVSDIDACTTMEDILATAANYHLPRRQFSLSYHDVARSRYRTALLPPGRTRSAATPPAFVSFLES